MRHHRVVIIGAGSAGLSARREIAKTTEDYIVVDDGPLGTTCARAGCMPSKVLIQVAEDFHRRKSLAAEGIGGGEGLSVDGRAVMQHVRALRDRFVRAVRGDMQSWEDKLVRKRARFVDENTLDLGDEMVRADKIIIGTGSSPVIPGPWRPLMHRLIDTEKFFELEELPKRVAVIGLGVIGLELGQALSRLGSEVVGVSLDKAYGGLTDPEVQDYTHEVFQRDFPVHLTPVEMLAEKDGDLVLTLGDGTELAVDAALVTVGRRPNLAGLGLEELGVDLRAIPVDPHTLRIAERPWYLPGDVNGTRPILHEASDEGRIAGYNAVRDEDQAFERRVSMGVTFSSPNIAMVGENHRQLTERGADFVTGRVSFEGQGRAIVKHKEVGLARLYVERNDGRLLGAELFAPDGEHHAHLLAWSIQQGLTVNALLGMPFYHPVTEEGLRTALRDAQSQLAQPPVGLELSHR